MRFVRSTDKFVIRGVHQIPQAADRCGCPVNKFLRCNSGFLCLDFNLLAMLVGSCLEEHIIAVFSLKSGDTVCQNDFITVSYMRLPRSIRNRSRNIILSFIAHNIPFLCILIHIT